MAETQAFLAGKHCLVLDDEFLITFDIQQLLETAGARVTCFVHVEAALAALQGEMQFDIAIIDIKVADTAADSLAVADALAGKGTPFVFLTGMRPDNIDVQRFPGVPVVEKPYQVDVLMAALRTVLGG